MTNPIADLLTVANDIDQHCEGRLDFDVAIRLEVEVRKRRRVWGRRGKELRAQLDATAARALTVALPASVSYRDLEQRVMAVAAAGHGLLDWESVWDQSADATRRLASLGRLVSQNQTDDDGIRFQTAVVNESRAMVFDPRQRTLHAAVADLGRLDLAITSRRKSKAAPINPLTNKSPRKKTKLFMACELKRTCPDLERSDVADKIGCDQSLLACKQYRAVEKEVQEKEARSRAKRGPM